MPSYTGHINPTKGLSKSDIPVYFSEKIIPEHLHKHTSLIENNKLSVFLTIIDNQCISVPYAPWGGILQNTTANYSDFENLINHCLKYAQDFNASELIIKQPPRPYSHSVSMDWFDTFGFEKSEETNQFIDLQSPTPFHTMEQRKIKKLQKHVQVKRELDITKYFSKLSLWRKSTGIPINISIEHLTQLFESHPDEYECWIAQNEKDTLAVCFTIQVTDRVIYYFLPATNPNYRSSSPMALLIETLCHNYLKLGFQYFDLGQTSIKGTKQEGLYRFKERMGATSTPKFTFCLSF